MKCSAMMRTIGSKRASPSMIRSFPRLIPLFERFICRGGWASVDFSQTGQEHRHVPEHHLRVHCEARREARLPELEIPGDRAHQERVHVRVPAIPRQGGEVQEQILVSLVE